MRMIEIAVLAGLSVAAISPAARAADLPPGSLPPAPVIEDDDESWYLRGDLGHAGRKDLEADFAAASFTDGLMRERVGETAVAGLGIGYRFGPHLRADVTLDHRFNAPFRGVAPLPAPVTGFIVDRGSLQSSTLMLNAYVDLGTAMGLTPYLGAGIGVARNVLSGTSRTVHDAATGAIQARDRLAAESDVSFAWALMAGIGYQLSSSFTLDLGYRYVNLGGVRTSPHRPRNGSDVESLGAHEVRLGVRYAFP